MHVHLSMYAAMFDAITTAVVGGTQVRASWFAQMQRALTALKLDDIDKPIAAPEGLEENPFAHVGWACRGEALT